MATKRILIRYRRLEGKSQIIQNQNQVHRKWCGIMFLFPFRACKWISIGPRVPAFENHHHPKMDRTIPSQIHVSKGILNLSPHNFERSFSSIRIAIFQVAPLANAGITGTPIGFGRPWRVTCVTCHYTCLLLLETCAKGKKKASRPWPAWPYCSSPLSKATPPTSMILNRIYDEELQEGHRERWTYELNILILYHSWTFERRWRLQWAYWAIFLSICQFWFWA